MSQVSNTTIGDMFSSLLGKVSTMGEDLKSQMSALEGKSLDSTQLVQLQFEMGQYNTMLESLSTVTKSLTDELKNIAQRQS